MCYVLGFIVPVCGFSESLHNLYNTYSLVEDTYTSIKTCSGNFLYATIPSSLDGGIEILFFLARNSDGKLS